MKRLIFAVILIIAILVMYGITVNNITRAQSAETATDTWQWETTTSVFTNNAVPMTIEYQGNAFIVINFEQLTLQRWSLF